MPERRGWVNIYKQDLALNNPQESIFHKILTNQLTSTHLNILFHAMILVPACSVRNTTLFTRVLGREALPHPYTIPKCRYWPGTMRVVYLPTESKNRRTTRTFSPVIFPCPRLTIATRQTILSKSRPLSACAFWASQQGNVYLSLNTTSLSIIRCSSTDKPIPPSLSLSLPLSLSLSLSLWIKRESHSFT